MNISETWRKIKFKIKKNKFLYVPCRKLKLAYLGLKRKGHLKKDGIKYIMEIDKILEKTSACFFVDAGTLLGIVRNKSLISWDLDIDFGIFIDDNFSWDDLEKSLKKGGFVLDHQYRFKGKITEQTYRRGKVFVDFFGHFSDESNSYFYAFYCKNGFWYENPNQLHTWMFKTVKISGTKKLELDNGYVHVPNETEEYLAGHYGKDWRTPNPNWVSGSDPDCITLGDSDLGLFEKIG